jgi:hypothetical protein
MLALIAIVIPLTFTSPDTGSSAIRRFEAQRCSQLDGCQPATLYADSLARDTVAVWAPWSHAEHRVWVSVTTTPNAAYGWRRGGQSIQVRARAAGGGVGPWSNPVDLAAGTNDSLFTNGRTWSLPSADHVVRFRRSVGDTDVVAGPVLDYETAVTASGWRAYLCDMFGKRALKGQEMGCP